MRHDSLIYDVSNSWEVLTGKYTQDEELKQRLFFEIKSAYTSDGRHFHNLYHIYSLLSLSNQYARYLSDKEVIDFAIFYHDIIYNVSKPDNEERSAELAKARLTELSLSIEKTEVVVDYILASKTHAIEQNQNESDLAWFIDFDMSILGAAWDRYLQYSQEVRKEYIIYPDIIYVDGRRNFLQQTLSMPFIFHTSEFRSKFEQTARDNIQKELDLLHTV